MLFRKLLRDIKGNYGAFLACISVLIIGMMLYVSMAIILDSLKESRDKYYSDYSLADGFVKVVKAPKTVVGQLEEIPGIHKVLGRIVQDVMVKEEASKDTTTLRLISYDTQDQELNRFQLINGRYPSTNSNEILVSPDFVKANAIVFGQKIYLIINGTKMGFAVVGTARSPEFVYEIPNGQTIAPNPRNFGIAYIPYSTMATKLQMNGFINDLIFSMDDGKTYDEIKSLVTKVLKQYGLIQLIPRKNQVSAAMIDQEIMQLKGTISTTPIIFLAVASVIIYIMLKRMIEQQRGQIGLLKAFGFRDREIVWHYLGYSLLIGTSGGFLGSVAGCSLSYYFADLYQQYYKIPGIAGGFSFFYIGIATLMSVLFSIGAGYQGCKNILKLSPASAMRPSIQGFSTRPLLERIRIVWNFLNSKSKMAIRNISRNKQRSLITVLGIAFAFGMMVTSCAMFDATYYLISFQYDKCELYDIKVSLNSFAHKIQATNAVKVLPGVNEVEPILEVPVTLNNRWLQKDVAITGIDRNNKLYRLLDQNEQTVEIPNDGLVISSQLATILQIKLGDSVLVHPALADSHEFMIQVKKIVPLYIGLGAYMNMDSLSEKLRSQPVATSVLLRYDASQKSALDKELQKGIHVMAVEDKQKNKSQFEELMKSSKSSQVILLLFSFILGFAIVYNVNIVALSERERELATLAVLGLTDREIRRILIKEQTVLASTAIVLGVPLGYGMMYGIAASSATDIYNMPVIVTLNSIGISLIGTVAFLVAAMWKVVGKVSKLSMTDVLKQQQ